MIEPALFRVLDVSTGHIAEDDTKFLHEGYRSLMVVCEHKYGWLLAVDLDDDGWLEQLKEDGIPKSIRTILSLAKDHGCHYVMLDADGTVYEELQRYEW